MKKNNIIHNDIKYDNILLHDKVFKFIDFGLSGVSSNINHFKNRSLSEKRSSRFYIWYPLEYIFNDIKNKEIDDEIYRLQSSNPRKGTDLLDIINNIYGRKQIDLFMEYYHKKPIHMKELIKGIDSYSLGIMIPALFLTKSNVNFPFEHSKKIKNFYILFGKMIEPDYRNRISAENILKEYNRILRN